VDAVHEEQRPGQGGAQACVVREAQRMMMRTRRRVWEQVQAQGEQEPVH